MLLRNRRLDVALKLIALLILSGLLLLPLRNLAYAFSPAEPLTVADPAHLAADGAAENRYVATTATPVLDRLLPYTRYGVRNYYYPLAEGEGRVFVRASLPPRTAAPFRLAGRLQRFDGVPFAGPVRQTYAQAFGQEVPHDAWIVLQDESPETYQIVLYAYSPLVFLWLAAFYLLVRGLQGRPALPGRRLA